MTNNKQITIQLNNDEWEYISGEVETLNTSPELLIKSLIENEIVERRKMEQSFFENIKNKDNYNEFVLALDYYLSVAVKESLQNNDKKMELVLLALRDKHMQKHTTMLELFNQYNND